MKQFNRHTPFGVEEIEDIQKYVDEYRAKFPKAEIKIGTDSKQAGAVTLYVTAICFVHERKGVHYVYKRETLPRVKDIFTRLFKEAELTVEVVEFLNARDYMAIHADYNTAKTHKSSAAGEAVNGWLIGAGYNVESKPDAFAASRAADAELKRKSGRRRSRRVAKVKTAAPIVKAITKVKSKK
jgi:hypothetical protein